mmetsp:Transcript_2595/g.6137  ORF Transcript_2595/g.6137 Transcript_2595/m.6137 type:complete len:207 (-) Transcript_2595:84-704(-)
MEVSLACCTLAEITNSDILRALTLERVTRACGLWDLCPERRGNRLEIMLLGTVMDGHLPTLTRVGRVSKTLIGTLLESEAAPDQSSSLAILAKNNILQVQCGAATDSSSLLTETSHVKRNTPLTLSLVEDTVKYTELHHILVDFHGNLLAHVGIELLLQNKTTFVHHTKAPKWLVGVAKMNAVVIAGEVRVARSRGLLRGPPTGVG